MSSSAMPGTIETLCVIVTPLKIAVRHNVHFVCRLRRYVRNGEPCVMK